MKKWISLIVVLFAAFLGLNSLVITYDDEYKLVRRFGKVDRVMEVSGISFKIPFVEAVDTLPRNIQLYDLKASDVITSDKKTMVADTYVLWKIDDPLKFAQSLNSINNAEGRIDASVYNALKTQIGAMSQSDVISARDGDLNTRIMASIGTSMDQYGIHMVSVEMKQLDLPSDNKTAVYERMISEREQIAASYTADGQSQSQIIKNGTDKEVTIMISEAQAEADKIVAEAQAKYMQILSEAYKNESKADFYSFVRALDAAKLSVKGENKTLILSKDSPLAQIFNGDIK